MRDFLITMLFIINSLLVIVIPTKAQNTAYNCTLQLSFTITDEHNQEQLAFATIYIKELQKGWSTNENGFAQILNICPGKYTLILRHLDCDSLVTEIQTDSLHLEYNFKLEHHSRLLKTITISADRQVVAPTQTISTLSGAELLRNRGTTLGETIKAIPGISTLNTGSTISKPVIHGMHSNRVLILNNGIRQEGQQWGNEHAPEIDAFMAQKITVVKGAMGVRYGSDAIGGVILIDPNALPDSGKINGELNLVTQSNGRSGTSSVILEGNIKKLSSIGWRLQGTAKQSGNLKTPDYFLNNTGTKELNFSAAAGWKKNKWGTQFFYSQFNSTIGIFKGSHIGNLTDLYNAINSPRPALKDSFTYVIGRPYQLVMHELTKLQGYYKISEGNVLNLTYGRQYNLRGEYDSHRPYNDSIANLNRPQLTFEITTHTIELAYDHHSDKGIVGTLGVNGIYQFNTFEGRYFIPNFQNQQIGAYLTERFIKEKYSIEAGFRYDVKQTNIYQNKKGVIRTTTLNFNNSSFTLAAHYQFNPQLKTNISLAKAWRAPSVNELFSNGVHHGAASYETGNPSLISEKAYSITAGLIYQNKKISAELSPYINYIRNYIFPQPDSLPIVTIRGTFPSFSQSQSNTVFTGIDGYLILSPFNSINFTSKGFYLFTHNLITQQGIPFAPANRIQNSIEIYSTKLAGFNKIYTEIAVLSVSKQHQAENLSDYMSVPKAYNLLNIEAGVKKNFKRNGVAFIFAVNNLLNQRYREYTDRFRYYADATGRNFNLKLNYQF